MKKPIVIVVELETDNPLLDPDKIDVSTVEAAQALRQAVVDSLPGLTRVMAVLPLGTAKLMMHAHEVASRAKPLVCAEEAGLAHTVQRPPPAYRPPPRKP